jgi:cell pole-organizing protein PopZ
MPKPEQSAEPSIEEILASIRKIIADDGAPARGPGGKGFAKPAADPHRGDPHYVAHPYRSGEMPEPRGEDELLELTEDFLVEEAELPPPAAPAEPLASMPAPHDTAAPPIPDRAAMAAQLMAADSAADAGLHTVLSNVAAEVERLASGEKAPLPTASRLFNAPPSEPAAEPHSRVAPPPATPAAAFAPEGLPQPEVRAAMPAPQNAQPASRARVHNRPVWSARRLEGGTASRGEQPSVPDLEIPEDTIAQGFGGRDRWEEGVQMPVPDTGPQIPFAYPPEPEAKGGPDLGKLAPPASSSSNPQAQAKESAESPLSDIENEKSFVGDFLTRVFGHSHERGEELRREEPTFNHPGLKGQAEKLAKATVSDFAADKLKAPPLAEALHADKPFMAQLTDSLESALAEVGALTDVERLDEPGSEPEFRVGQTAAADVPAAHPATSEELPEPPPLVDVDLPFTSSTPEASEFRSAPVVQQAPAAAPASISAAPKVQPQPPHAAHADPIFEERKADAAPSAATQLPAGIEDSIKDMIKPLIVQWLNDNLARIVERAVREELDDRRHGFSEFGGKR